MWTRRRKKEVNVQSQRVLLTIEREREGGRRRRMKFLKFYDDL